MKAARDRRLLLIVAGLFAISTAFPIVASVIRGPAPRWLGVLDVVLAAALVCGGIMIASRIPKDWTPEEISASFRVLRGGSIALLVLSVVFVAGGHLKWEVLLVGLAWRAWLLAWVLPSAVALWVRRAAGDEARMDHLFLNTIAFPVRRGVLFRGRKSLGDYCWELEVYCDESPEFADQEAPDDLLAGAAPLLSAQSLPCASSRRTS